jgi:hypothetical protein
MAVNEAQRADQGRQYDKSQIVFIDDTAVDGKHSKLADKAEQTINAASRTKDF